MTQHTKITQQAIEALRLASRTSYSEANQDVFDAAIEALQAAQPAEPTDWRELCRRLYVELFHVDQQLCSVMNENDEPVYTQGSTVRDVLKEASAALAQPAQPGWLPIESAPKDGSSYLVWAGGACCGCK